jgi:HEAT repeat protein
MNRFCRTASGSVAALLVALGALSNLVAADRDVDELVRQLGSKKFSEREAAGRALEKLGEAALPALQKAAQGADPEVRRRAAALIETIRERQRTANLIRALKDPDEHARARAENELISLDRQAVPDLLRLLEGKDAALRASAVRILCQMGTMGRRHADVLPALARALRDSEVKVRREAAEAIRWIAVLPKEVPKELVPALVEGLRDADEMVRVCSEGSLAELDRHAVPALLELLKGKDNALRASAARILGQMATMGRRHRDAIPALKEALKAQDEELRRWARYALHRVDQ